MRLILAVLSDRVVSDCERERIRLRVAVGAGSFFTRSRTRIVTSAADVQLSVRVLGVRCLRSADGGARTALEIEIRDVRRGVDVRI